MSQMVNLDGLVAIGKETLENVTGKEGVGVFDPILLAEYEDDKVEITLIAGDPRDGDLMTPALIEVANKGPLRSLALTTDAWVGEQGADQIDAKVMDALIVLLVTIEGAESAIAPYDFGRTAHQATIVWGEVQKGDSDPELANRLRDTLIVSRHRAKLPG